MGQAELRILGAALLLVLLWPGVPAGAAPETITAVVVTGAGRIDAGALAARLKAEAGPLDPVVVDNDIKTLYRTGFFRQVRAVLTPVADGQVLEYQVQEKPLVRKVFMRGNKKISEKDLGEVIRFTDQRLVDEVLLGSIVTNATAYYQSKGFYDAAIEYELTPVAENQVDVTFSVKEGEKFKIREIRITGLEKLKESDARNVLQTKRYKWWSSWLFGTGRVNPQLLEADKALLQQYLLDNGLIEGGVSDAVVEKRDDRLVVVFDVREGPQYRVGRITASGDLVDGSPELTLADIAGKSGEVFSATKLREDAFRISDKFGDQGYAFANVIPNTAVNRGTRLVDIDFASARGDPVYINEILITGNDKTYDHVIRRELKIQEQELYARSQIKRSQQLLERLGYFEEVSVVTEATDQKDQVDLKINVREGSTGSFSAGVGYSTSDGMLLHTRLSENNFLGTGRSLQLNLDYGTKRENYILSLNDRRINDSFWSGGLEAYRTQREFSTFERQLTGAGARVGYPLEYVFGDWAQDIMFYLRYDYLNIDIYDVDPLNAAPLVIQSQGESTASSLTPELVRSTINNPLSPTRGSRQVLMLEIAGLGGSEEYYLAQFRNQWYYPIFNPGWGDVVFSWRFRVAYGDTYNDETFPLFRRFFPGGINTVRGYRERSLGPQDEDGNEYGGSKELVNNLELIVPLVESAGLRSVFFFDAGEAFDDDVSIDLGDLRLGYGAGLRWTSPIGPLRIEFGFPIDREPGERSMVTMFSFGAPL